MFVLQTHQDILEELICRYFHKETLENRNKVKIICQFSIKYD